MKISTHVVFPPDYKSVVSKVKKIEWITLGFLISVIILMALVMGSSQAMKSTVFDELFGLVAGSSFLLAMRYYNRKPNEKYPYGYHKSISLAFLCSSFGLLSIGLYIFIDSVITLVKAEHATIGSYYVFGMVIWKGWIMIAVLLYSIIPAVILGKMKKPLAQKLKDRVILTDSKMNKAEWLSGSAAIVGVTGIYFGLWWADAATAIFISIDILHDGYTNISKAVKEMMDATPRKLEQEGQDPLVEEVRQKIKEQSWVKDANLRLRESGHIYFGEVDLYTNSKDDIASKVMNLQHSLKEWNWRIHDLTFTVVDHIRT